MMGNRLWVSALAIFGAALCAMALTPAETEARMDEIKLDDKYIYGESYDSDPLMAYDNALTELVAYANEIREARELPPLNPSSLQTTAQELKYSDGDRHAVFLYIPLEKMLGMVSRSHADVVAAIGVAAPVAEEPAPAQVASEQPAPVNDKKLTFVPDRRPAPGPHPTEPGALAPDDILETLSAQDTWLEIRGFLSSYKNDKRISATGATYDFAEVPDDAYAILIDDMGGILAILSPKNNPRRINYKTHVIDNESNYSNCKFIVWYK
ncbi:MAG: hypothetical protein JFR38_02630 [Muribaculaceae bacterium]|nr:hypothetical protein [Muribaculaceae bacterium]